MVSVKQCFESMNVADITKTDPTSGLKLFVFTSDQEIQMMVVGLDGFVINMGGTSFAWGILVCLASYYVFNLKYSKPYWHIKAVMQDFIMNDPYDNWSAASAKLKNLYNWLKKNENSPKFQQKNVQRELQFNEGTSGDKLGKISPKFPRLVDNLKNK